MSEYIERESAIAVIEEKQKELCPVGMYSRRSVYGSDREKFDAWQEIIDTLEAIPAADVREVVTCEECKFYKAENKGKPWKANRCYCTRSAAVATDPDDFCSRGERHSADMRICSTNHTNPATTGENREVSDVRAWLNNGAEMREES